MSVVNRTLSVGICPAYRRHRPEDAFCGTGLVVGDSKAGIHCSHNSLSEVDVLDLTCVDTDVTVAELIGVGALDALLSELLDGCDVIVGELRSYVVDLAALKSVKCV